MSKKKYEYPENLWDAVVQRSKELKDNRILKLFRSGSRIRVCSVMFSRGI